MKSKAKILAILVVIVSLGLVLAACGAQAEPTATSVPATATPTPAPTPVPATATPTPGPTVKVTKDVAYTTPLQPGDLASELGSGVPGYGSVQTLDVYAPTEPGPWPVVVFVHGINEWKELYTDLSQAIAEQGTVVFTINWPVVYPIRAVDENGVRLRESHETLVCAIRFAHATASDYGGDPDRVTLAGFTMGGAYGAYTALVGDDSDRLWEEFASARGGPPSQVDCVASGGSAHVDAFVGISGWYDRVDQLQEKDPELWELNSIYSHLGENTDLKVRLVHGEDDHESPYEFASRLDSSLTEAGYDTALTPFDGGPFIPSQLIVEEIMNAVGE